MEWPWAKMRRDYAHHARYVVGESPFCAFLDWRRLSWRRVLLASVLVVPARLFLIGLCLLAAYISSYVTCWLAAIDVRYNDDDERPMNRTQRWVTAKGTARAQQRARVQTRPRSHRHIGDDGLLFRRLPPRQGDRQTRLCQGG